MKFIHCADIHLDSPLKGLERHDQAPLHEIRNASRRAFDTLVTLCLEESVDFLLIAGDLFDGAWRDFNTALYFVKQANRLKEANITLFLVRGNHDAQSRFVHHIRFPDNVKVFSSENAETFLLERLQVAIHGRSFAKPAVTTDLSLSYPWPKEGYYNIGLLHTALNGREGHERYAPCSPENLVSKGYDYWALGHVHGWEVIRAGDPWMVFPGTVQGRHIRETGAKGCALVTVSDGLRTSVAFRALDSLRWSEVKVDLFGVMTIDAALEQTRAALSAEYVKAEGRNLAARLLFEGYSPMQEAMLRRSGEWFDEVLAVAFEVASGSIWVEKMVFTSPAIQTEMPVGMWALGELSAIQSELASDPQAMAALAKSLWGELRGVMPGPVIEAEDGLRFDDPVWQQKILERAAAMATVWLTRGES